MAKMPGSGRLAVERNSLRSRRRKGAGPLTRLPMVALDCDFATGLFGL